jgi:hypothetical protein
MILSAGYSPPAHGQRPAATNVPVPVVAEVAKPNTGVSLDKEQQEELLKERLDGGMRFKFTQFANMFLVSSRINLGSGVALVATTEEIAKVELESPFPKFYKPTLRQFLDAIALQTFSEWKYDPTAKHVKREDKDGPAVSNLNRNRQVGVSRRKPLWES